MVRINIYFMDDSQDFRNKIYTISDSGRREWIYPKKPNGKYYRYRIILSYFLITFFIVSPFFKIDGNQFILLNIFERKFNLFGIVFWPQDFHLIALLLIIMIVFVIFFTVVFGRIFCGWICPQTIFLEMIFRRIEYLIEGDRSSQIKLDKQNWNFYKFKIKFFKWFVFYILSFLISNVFLSYIIGSDKLLTYVVEGPFKSLSVFIPLLFFSIIFYFVFAWFREQVCVIACPYGRLQSVLIDNNSIIIAYDHLRGERDAGRKKLKINENRNLAGLGDCIDCQQCVKVCPTGIDIRNGIQLECVNCTACIDACDNVMNKIGFKKNLIGYFSQFNINDNKKIKLKPRVISYLILLTFLFLIFFSMLFSRNNLETRILRLPGKLFEYVSEDSISNIYQYKLINKSNKIIDNIKLRVNGIDGVVKLVSNLDYLALGPNEVKNGIFFVNIHQNDINVTKTKIFIEILKDNKVIETENIDFIGPINF